MRTSLWKSIAISLLLLPGLSNPIEASLLTSPPLIMEKEVVERASTLSLGMTWETSDKENGQRRSLGFKHKKGQTVMQIQCEGKFPQELAPFKNCFTLSTPQGKKVWTFVHGDTAPSEPTSSVDTPLSLEESMGIIHPPLILHNHHPQAGILSDVAAHIRDKHCVFYTGAGISASIVPTMAQLIKSLQLEECKDKGKFFITFQHALKNPAFYIQPMADFYKACLYGEPTSAHLAIRDIVLKMKWGLLTENLDLLHQRSGIKPLHHEGSHWLTSNVSEADLKQIEYVITVGLANDESGFLGWYKSANPKGIIIALNLQQPNYLGAEDVLVIGDIQQILPLLRKELF